MAQPPYVNTNIRHSRGGGHADSKAHTKSLSARDWRVPRTSADFCVLLLASRSRLQCLERSRKIISVCPPLSHLPLKPWSYAPNRDSGFRQLRQPGRGLC
eukprot:2762043-Prymnesium_polylepis.2